jgi:hypothetical protein
LLRFDQYSWEIVPSKVVEIAWNDRFILAKQQEMEPGRLHVATPAKFYYWIIDMVQTNKLGPFSEDEFKKKLVVDGLTNIELKAVNKINWPTEKDPS